MSDENEPLTLEPGMYGHVGVVLCAVTKGGQVSVAGDVADIDDGGSQRFARARITATRTGNSYQFTK